MLLWRSCCCCVCSRCLLCSRYTNTRSQSQSVSVQGLSGPLSLTKAYCGGVHGVPLPVLLTSGHVGQERFTRMGITGCCLYTVVVLPCLRSLRDLPICLSTA